LAKALLVLGRPPAPSDPRDDGPSASACRNRHYPETTPVPRRREDRKMSRIAIKARRRFEAASIARTSTLPDTSTPTAMAVGLSPCRQHPRATRRFDATRPPRCASAVTPLNRARATAARCRASRERQATPTPTREHRDGAGSVLPSAFRPVEAAPLLSCRRAMIACGKGTR